MYSNNFSSTIENIGNITKYFEENLNLRALSADSYGFDTNQAILSASGPSNSPYLVLSANGGASDVVLLSNQPSMTNPTMTNPIVNDTINLYTPDGLTNQCNISYTGINPQLVQDGMMYGYNFTINNSKLANTCTYELGQDLGTGNRAVIYDTTNKVLAYTGLTPIYGDTINIGSNSGKVNPAQYSINIGADSGRFSAGLGSVNIGFQSGFTGPQGLQNTNIGIYAGSKNQQSNCVAIGYSCGYNNQATGSVAIGNSAGSVNQSQNCIAIGTSAGQSSQGDKSIAIGYFAGQSQGQNAIALGPNAGLNNQGSNSILLNATPNALDCSASGCYINPINQNNGPTGTILQYDTTTKQLTYNSTVNWPIEGGTLATLGGSNSFTGYLGMAGTGYGFGVPRMSTTQKNAIVSPTGGYLVYDTTQHQLNVYNGNIPAWTPSGSMTLLQKLTSDGSSTVSSSSLPNNFNHLRLYMVMNYTGPSDNTISSLAIQFNNDSASNYIRQYFRTQNNTFQGGVSQNQTSILISDYLCQNTTPTYATQITVDIPFYNSSFYKTAISNYLTLYASANTNCFNGQWGGCWRNSAAITSLKIIDVNGRNIDTGSLIYIYGIY